jgi:hypothetical protein
MRGDSLEPGVIGLWRQAILLPRGLDDPDAAISSTRCCSTSGTTPAAADNLTAALHGRRSRVLVPPGRVVDRTQLIDERERACDQGVLEQAPATDTRSDPQRLQVVPARAATCVSGVTGADLRARIESVLRGTRRRRSARLGARSSARRGRAGRRAVLRRLLDRSRPLRAAGQQLPRPRDGAEKTSKWPPSSEQRRRPAWRLGPPGRGAISIVNLPLRNIIVQSFRTQRPMVFGGPSWIDEKRFDIVGKGPDATVSNPGVWGDDASLLIERFKLKYHIEDREMAVFALTIGKNGHKLIAGEKGAAPWSSKQGRLCGDILVPPFGTGIYNMPVGALLGPIAAAPDARSSIAPG